MEARGGRHMEKFPTLQEEEEREAQQQQPPPPRGLFSCWSCIKRAFPWRRLRRRGRRRRGVKPGKFRYDPISYSQNFEEAAPWDKDDDDGDDGDDDHFYRGFSSRFAVIKPAIPPDEGH